MAFLDETGLQRYTDKVKEYVQSQKGQEIQALQGQVSDLQTQVNTLFGYYNELENIIG